MTTDNTSLSDGTCILMYTDVENKFMWGLQPDDPEHVLFLRKAKMKYSHFSVNMHNNHFNVYEELIHNDTFMGIYMIGLYILTFIDEEVKRMTADKIFYTDKHVKRQKYEGFQSALIGLMDLYACLRIEDFYVRIVEIFRKIEMVCLVNRSTSFYKGSPKSKTNFDNFVEFIKFANLHDRLV